MLMWILGMLLFGLIVGAIARLLIPGRDPMGWLATIGLGIGGSFLGGFVASLFSPGPLELQPTHFLGSLLGAVALLLLYRSMGGRKVRT